MDLRRSGPGAYLQDQQSWYLEPQLDLGINGFDHSDLEESGSTGAELHVKGESETYCYLRPELEVAG